MRCREGGRTVHVAALIAVGVNADGKREVLGLELVTGEDGAGWLAFVRGLVARGLAGVQLAISDAHPGLRAALGATLLRSTTTSVDFGRLWALPPQLAMQQLVTSPTRSKRMARSCSYGTRDLARWRRGL